MKKLIIPISIIVCINLSLIICGLLKMLPPIMSIFSASILTLIILYLMIYIYLCKKKHQETIYSLEIEMELNRTFLKEIYAKNEIISSLENINIDLEKEKELLGDILFTSPRKKIN